MTNKSEIKKFKNGQLFTIDLIDDTGEMKCVVFNEVVDQFYKVIEISFLYKFKNFLNYIKML